MTHPYVCHDSFARRLAARRLAHERQIMSTRWRSFASRRSSRVAASRLANESDGHLSSAREKELISYVL